MRSGQGRLKGDIMAHLKPQIGCLLQELRQIKKLRKRRCKEEGLPISD
jgi:hypothetical protein